MLIRFWFKKFIFKKYHTSYISQADCVWLCKWLNWIGNSLHIRHNRCYTPWILNTPWCLAVKGDVPKEMFSVHSCWPVSWMYCLVCNHYPFLCQQYQLLAVPNVCKNVSKWWENKLLKFTDLFTWDLGSPMAVKPALVSEVN